jgi:hypothetical protein
VPELLERDRRLDEEIDDAKRVVDVMPGEDRQPLVANPLRPPFGIGESGGIFRDGRAVARGEQRVDGAPRGRRLEIEDEVGIDGQPDVAVEQDGESADDEAAAALVELAEEPVELGLGRDSVYARRLSERSAQISSSAAYLATRRFLPARSK